MRYTILNRVGETSLFKRGLHEVVSSPGSRLVLGYGYLKINAIKSLIEDKGGPNPFVTWIESDNSSDKELYIIGANSKNYDEYEMAAQYLNTIFVNLTVKVIIKELNKGNNRQYHKKLAIKFKEHNKTLKPVIALMGSSNFSIPAYKDANYNQEVDILMWNRFLLEDSSKGLKFSREEESKMLKRLEKEDGYIKKYHELQDLMINPSIDFGLDLQLEDIIDEIDNYSSKGFELVKEYYRLEIKIDIVKLKSILKSRIEYAENQIYKNQTKPEKLFSQDLQDKVTRDSILHLYEYAQNNLDNSSNSQYFEKQKKNFKLLIDKKTKAQIKEILEDEGYYRYFKKRTFRNTIEGIEIYDVLMYIMGVQSVEA